MRMVWEKGVKRWHQMGTGGESHGALYSADDEFPFKRFIIQFQSITLINFTSYVVSCEHFPLS